MLARCGTRLHAGDGYRLRNHDRGLHIDATEVADRAVSDVSGLRQGSTGEACIAVCACGACHDSYIAPSGRAVISDINEKKNRCLLHTITAQSVATLMRVTQNHVGGGAGREGGA